jgi:hypothetical protein
MIDRSERARLLNQPHVFDGAAAGGADTAGGAVAAVGFGFTSGGGAFVPQHSFFVHAAPFGPHRMRSALSARLAPTVQPVT